MTNLHLQGIISTALRVATEAHSGQFRKGLGNAPYIVHPMRVSLKVADISGFDVAMTSAALLHDVLEDCPEWTPERLGRDFAGEDFATCNQMMQYVLSLTNPSKKFQHLSRAERKQIDRNWLSSQSVEVRIIKAVDRADNLGDVGGLSEDFVRLYCQESRDLLEVLDYGDLGIAGVLLWDAINKAKV